LEYWEVARNWDGCVPEISVALVCCETDKQSYSLNSPPNYYVKEKNMT
jgi:hypothetical protein